MYICVFLSWGCIIYNDTFAFSNIVLLFVMLIKKADISCVFQWSPIDTQPNMIAAGSIAGAMSDDFSSNAALCIYSFDLFDESCALNLEGSIEVHEKMTQLAWTTHPNYDMGLLGTALVDGIVNIYDPLQIVAKTLKSEPVCSIEAHGSSLKALEFNPIHRHLLATAGHDRDIRVWSLQNPLEPSLSVSPTSPKNPIAGDIQCMQWHGKLSHILACCSSSGHAHIFDLKAKRCTSTFSNAKQPGAFTCLAWNPDEATQIAVAVDSKCPEIQIWDLRRAVAPIRSFSAHKDTILSLSWGKSDSNMLLSSGADGNFFCWNPNSGELVAEFEQRSDWVSDVQWSIANPTLFATSGYDNLLSVFSMNGISESSRSMSNTTWKTAPKWLKRPCTIAHKSDGSLLAVHNEVHSCPTVSVMTMGPNEDTCLCKSEWGKVLQELSAARTIFDVKRRADTIRTSWGSLQSVTDSIDRTTFAQLVSIPLSIETGGDIKAIKDILQSKFKGSHIVQRRFDRQDANISTDLIGMTVLSGNIDDAVQVCIRNGHFDDAFMMLPFASADIQNEVYSEYAQQNSETFFIRALNGVRTDSVVEVIEMEKNASWNEVFLYALTFCDEFNFKIALETISKRLEKNISHGITDELQENVLGLLLIALLQRDCKVIFQMVVIDSLCEFDQENSTQTAQQFLKNSSYFEKCILDMSSIQLLEITSKALALCAFFDVHDMPEQFFALISKICRLFIAEGSRNAALALLSPLFGKLDLEDSYSLVKKECIIMLDQLSVSMGSIGKNIWQQPIATDNSNYPLRMPDNSTSLGNTNNVRTQSELINFGVVSQSDPMPSSKKDVLFLEKKIASICSASSADKQGQPSGSHPTSIQTRTDIVPDFDAHALFQEPLQINQLLYSSQSEQAECTPDIHKDKAPHNANSSETSFLCTFGGAATKAESNDGTQSGIQKYGSPAIEANNISSPLSKTEPKDVDPRVPPQYSSSTHSAPQSSATVQYASPSSPLYDSASCGTFGDNRPPLVQSNVDDHRMTPKDSQSNIVETCLSEKAQTLLNTSQTSSRNSMSCLSMPLLNIKPESLENEVISNFQVLLSAVSDKRKKECIGKALFTLFQELNSGGIEKGLIELLHRFTLCAQTVEGKDLIKTMGAVHWNSFRKFMNIRFL